MAGKSSVARYAVEQLGGKTTEATGFGGAAILDTDPHALGGAEHTGDLDVARLATTELDTTKVAAPDGAGGVTFRAETGGSGGMTPTYLGPAEVFEVPDNRQALYATAIVLDVGAGITLGVNAALIGVT